MFSFSLRAFGQRNSHSSQSDPFNFSPVLSTALCTIVSWLLLDCGEDGARSWCSSLCTSCCGLNLSVLSWLNHLSDRFFDLFPTFPGRRRPLSLFGLDWNRFSSFLLPFVSASPCSPCCIFPPTRTDLPWNAELLLRIRTELCYISTTYFKHFQIPGI